MNKNILKRIANAEIGTSSEKEGGLDQSLLSRRHSSPVVTNVGRALSQLGEDSIVTLDPNKIDRSPFQDRFEGDAETDSELELLKASIAAEGQKVPVLVRPHPSKEGRYQLAYGYRRLAAIKALAEEKHSTKIFKIRAFVRELTDRQLIEEQSIENGVREGLTWIEQAMWARQLKSAGFSQRAICPILGLSEAAVSHLFRVTSTIPEDVIYAIGRAKSVGRPKWTSLAENMKETTRLTIIRHLIQTEKFKSSDSLTRFAMVTAITKSTNLREADDELIEARNFSVGKSLYGRMKSTSNGVVMTIPKQQLAFANWLADRMPMLVREFRENS